MADVELPEYILTKIPDTVVVELSGRQCQAIDWIFTDFIEAAAQLPEMPEDLIVACRSIATFARMQALSTHNSPVVTPIKMPVLQAHFIAFALTLEAMRRIPDRRDMLDTVGAVARAFAEKYGKKKEKPPKEL